MMIRWLSLSTLVCTLALLLPRTLHAQQKTVFAASDGLQITSDLYFQGRSKPFVLLFHQSGSSRGEYRKTADRLMKLGYNCLAVDLRSGGESGYVRNETAARALETGIDQSPVACTLDIEAAIQFAHTYNKEKVILLGSSFSASLAMIHGKNDPRVKAIVAFSPGEFFGPGLKVKESLQGFGRPLFVAATTIEVPYIEELLAHVPAALTRVFTPGSSPGTHGARALWVETPGNEEYWLALMLFFNGLKSR